MPSFEGPSTPESESRTVVTSSPARPSYIVSPSPADEIQTSGTPLDESSAYTTPANNTPVNTPAILSPIAARDQGRSQGEKTDDDMETKHVNLNIVHHVDLRAVTYVGNVNENLMCPICRCPLVDPVLTDCDHVFCRTCLEDSLALSLTCPIDRSPLPLDLVASTNLAPAFVRNQLDGLLAKCPCCSKPFARSMLDHHLEKYCPEATMRCAGRNTESKCMENIKRKISDRGCLHVPAKCEDCQEVVQQINMDHHREFDCKDRLRYCGNCGRTILRLKGNEHDAVCPEAIVPCKWAEYGCEHTDRRKVLNSHKEECSYKLVGPIAEIMKSEINGLRSDLRLLSEKNKVHERRIKFLETGSRQDVHPPLDYNDLASPYLAQFGAEAGNTDTLNHSQEYLLSLLEVQETNLAHLSADMSALEAKQTNLLFNETLPMKNELIELRSMMQTCNMHVRWLMKFRIQDVNNRRTSRSTSNGGGSDGEGSGEGWPMRRRLSDSLRDMTTKL